MKKPEYPNPMPPSLAQEVIDSMRKIMENREPKTPPFTYLEFLEFSHEEFEKFRDKLPINAAECLFVDMLDLCNKLQEKNDGKA